MDTPERRKPDHRGQERGRDAAMWTFLLRNRDGLWLKKTDLGTWHAGKGYALLGAAPEDEFEEWRPLFEHAAETFCFDSADTQP